MRILVVNQYFHPDRSATAQLLTELCDDLSRNQEIQVVTGRPSYNQARSLDSWRDRTAALAVARHALSLDRYATVSQALVTRLESRQAFGRELGRLGARAGGAHAVD